MSTKRDDWTYCNICNRHILDDSLNCDPVYYDEERNAICEQCEIETEKGAS